MTTSLDWRVMCQIMQEFHLFARNMLAQQKKCTLTTNELELLSLLYLNQSMTPMALSKATGMKIESISRSLKSLLQKNFVFKGKSPQDERCYPYALTQQGDAELNKNYQWLLQPLYHLHQTMGIDFETMATFIQKANTLFRQAEEADKIAHL